MSPVSPLSPQSELVEFLGRVKSLGRRKIRRLAPQLKDLNALLRLPIGKIASFAESLQLQAPEEFRNAVLNPVHADPPPRFFSYLDAIFPDKLNHLHDPPCGLYYQGLLDLLHLPRPWIGVVGTRRASHYGLKMCERLIRRLAPFKPVIVSGMAKGIDGRAHETALNLGLSSIGVLGSPIHMVYPPSHGRLFAAMIARGLLLSEIAPEAPQGPWRFPERNRLIAALADALVVVEAPVKSGALLTAREALDLGREIFVVPGAMDNELNLGGHRLIQDGAHLLTDPLEILEALKIIKSARDCPPEPPRIPIEPASSEEKRIVQLLAAGPLHIDKIVELSELAAPLAAGLLTQMELRGLIAALPGKVYEINRE